MSVLVENEFGWIVDHQQEINKTYAMTYIFEKYRLCDFVSERQIVCQFRAVPALFAIRHRYMMDSQFTKSMKINQMLKNSAVVAQMPDVTGSDHACELACKSLMPALQPVTKSKIKDYVENAMKQLSVSTFFSEPSDVCHSEDNVDNNVSARLAAHIAGFTQEHHSIVCTAGDDSQHYARAPLFLEEGGNLLLKLDDIINRLVSYMAPVPTSALLDCHKFLLPARCRFLLSDISHISPLLSDGAKYDCIVIDPPWQNKSVKRKKLYSTLSDSSLLKLPVRDLCAADALVVVWVTNKLRQQHFVKDHLFPCWNVTYLSDWYWLKVTQSGRPVCDFDDTRSTKRPYEVLIIGRMVMHRDDTAKCNVAHRQLPDHRVIVSVPCSIHSRKPPLGNILAPYLPENPQRLELFARNLSRGWTSWGNEVLAYQHHDYFVQLASCVADGCTESRQMQETCTQ